MNTFTYEKVCEKLETGEKPRVTNTENHETGEVYMCQHGFFNVHVGHGSEVWRSDQCEPSN